MAGRVRKGRAAPPAAAAVVAAVPAGEEDAAMRVRILHDVPNYTPSSDRRIGFRFAAGEEKTVRRIFGLELLALGHAEEVDVPPRADPEG